MKYCGAVRSTGIETIETCHETWQETSWETLWSCRSLNPTKFAMFQNLSPKHGRAPPLKRPPGHGKPPSWHLCYCHGKDHHRHRAHRHRYIVTVTVIFIELTISFTVELLVIGNLQAEMLTKHELKANDAILTEKETVFEELKESYKVLFCY